MTRADQILGELRPGLSPKVLAQIPALMQLLTDASRVCIYGVGREGLMMKALAMRLYHLGLDAHVVGDMTTPAVAETDLLFVSAGPGHFSTVLALVMTARAAGAKVICVTAEPDGPVPKESHHIVHLPAQTMASDQTKNTASILPMGSLYEALMFLFFELLVLEMCEQLCEQPEAMRARHTNLE